MEKRHKGVIGAIISGTLLLTTGHGLLFLPLIACSAFYGWNLGKQLFPPEEYGG